MVRFGYACKTVGLPHISTKGCTLRYATPEKLLEVSRHNLAAARQMVEYNASYGLGLLRLSSDSIPLASHPLVNFDWVKLCKQELEMLGQSIKTHGIRVSMHPGQYTVLNSPDAMVVERSVADLVFHTNFLDALGLDSSAKIILHVGGVYGDKPNALERFMVECRNLPKNVQDRLVLENDERSYAIHEVLNLCDKLQLPAVFDVFHHSLLPSPGGGMLDWLDRAAQTWRATDGRQKIHYSQQMIGEKPGRHSKNIQTDAFLAFYASLAERDLDIMLEVKDKNVSAVKCRTLCQTHAPRKTLTEEWARYKYLVLERSPLVYTEIRELLKQEQPEVVQFYTCVERALALDLTYGGVVNAAEHVWGYLNKVASPRETKRVRASIDACQTSFAALAGLKKQLLTLAERKKDTYLLQSLYFYYDF